MKIEMHRAEATHDSCWTCDHFTSQKRRVSTHIEVNHAYSLVNAQNRSNPLYIVEDVNCYSIMGNNMETPREIRNITMKWPSHSSLSVMHKKTKPSPLKDKTCSPARHLHSSRITETCLHMCWALLLNLKKGWVTTETTWGTLTIKINPTWREDVNTIHESTNTISPMYGTAGKLL